MSKVTMVYDYPLNLFGLSDKAVWIYESTEYPGGRDLRVPGIHRRIFLPLNQIIITDYKTLKISKYILDKVLTDYRGCFRHNPTNCDLMPLYRWCELLRSNGEHVKDNRMKYKHLDNYVIRR